MRAVMPRPTTITSTCPIEEHEEDVGSHSTSDPEVASTRMIADEAKRVANNDKSALRNKSLDNAVFLEGTVSRASSHHADGC